VPGAGGVLGGDDVLGLGDVLGLADVLGDGAMVGGGVLGSGMYADGVVLGVVVAGDDDAYEAGVEAGASVGGGADPTSRRTD
jgi:hypothetical protein